MITCPECGSTDLALSASAVLTYTVTVDDTTSPPAVKRDKIKDDRGNEDTGHLYCAQCAYEYQDEDYWVEF